MINQQTDFYHRAGGVPTFLKTRRDDQSVAQFLAKVNKVAATLRTASITVGTGPYTADFDSYIPAVWTLSNTKGTATLAGADGNGGIVYNARACGNVGITVRHVVAGANTPLSVSVASSAITVNVATNAGSVATSVANDIVTAINASATAAPLVQATATGTGAGLVVAVAFQSVTDGTLRGGAYLQGLPAGGTNSDILYTSDDPGNTAITVRHVVSGINTARSISVTGTAITVNVATDGGGAVKATETTASIAASVNNTAASGMLVTAIAQGTGLGVVQAVSATTLTQGIPSNTISIATYTQIYSGAPTATQFIVDYNTGIATFNSAASGAALSATYYTAIAPAPKAITAISTLAGTKVRLYGRQVRPVGNAGGLTSSGTSSTYRSDFMRLFDRL